MESRPLFAVNKGPRPEKGFYWKELKTIDADSGVQGKKKVRYFSPRVAATALSEKQGKGGNSSL